MDYPIRVLCVFSTLDRGGAESMCMNLYRNIDRAKVQFDFVKHTNDRGAFEDEIESLGGIIYTAPRPKPYNYVKYCAWWKKHLNNHKEHQIIHGHYFTVSKLYFKIAKEYKRATIAHSHIAKLDSIALKLMCRGIEKYADYCLACGRDAGKLLYKKRHFIVINNAIDLNRFKYRQETRELYRKELDVEDDIVIGIVANFGTHKNPFGVIDLFKTLVHTNRRYKLLWVGGGSLQSEVERRIKEYRIQDRVKLLGVRQDVDSLMQAMDAFILPSFYEGLPVVMIEAQAVGLKCFISNEVAREANVTGRCEYLPLNNWNEWVTKIECTELVHEDTYRSLKEAGYDILDTSKWVQDFYLTISRSAIK